MPKRSRLPVLSGPEVIKALSKIGFRVTRQRGSHVVLRHEDGRRVTVPLHNELDRGTLAAIMTQAGLTREEFTALL